MLQISDILIDTCNLGGTPTLSAQDAPLGFNSSCLCPPKLFREYAPRCIDCLFRSGIEDGFREKLLMGLNGCTRTLKEPACPISCHGVAELTEQCNEEDSKQQSAAEAKETDQATLNASATEGPETSETPTPTIK
jgi:hypothetical protein